MAEHFKFAPLSISRRSRQQFSPPRALATTAKTEPEPDPASSANPSEKRPRSSSPPEHVSPAKRSLKSQRKAQLPAVASSDDPFTPNPAHAKPSIDNQIAAIIATGLQNDSEWSELEPALLLVDPLIIGDLPKLARLKKGFEEARARVRKLKHERSRETVTARP